VNLIQEEHLPVANIGQDRRQIALDLQRRSARLLKTNT
jgi:hypothetical protein